MKLIRRLLGYAFATTVAAANLGDWTSVTRVSAGTQIEVIHGRLRRTSGVLVAATAEDITVETAMGSTVIARSEVRRVSLIRHSKKKRILLATAIGAGIGAAAAAIGVHSGDIDIRHDYVVAAGLVAGGGVGAVIGAASSGPVTIYRAP